MNDCLPINQIVSGNCLDIMKTFPDGCIDLTITSPPYDNLMEYNGYSFNFESIAKDLFRITKESGVVVWVIGDATLKGSETGTSFRQALYFKECGFNLHDTMIWVKSNPMPSFKAPRYNQSFEYMFVFSKGLPKTFNPLKEKCKTAGQSYTSVKVMTNRKVPTRKILSEPKKKKETKNLSNVWTMGHAYKNYGHPAVFPELLAENHIRTWTNLNDLIFDPFMGSGTTAAMALKTERNFIGCDISEEYVKIANERIRPYLQSNEILKQVGIEI
jgi:DNA modification methylase